jgi:hypothetical protein
VISARDPAAMAPKERLRELASILATGYLRHVSARGAQRSGDDAGDATTRTAAAEAKDGPTSPRRTSSLDRLDCPPGSMAVG